MVMNRHEDVAMASVTRGTDLMTKFVWSESFVVAALLARVLP